MDAQRHLAPRKGVGKAHAEAQLSTLDGLISATACSATARGEFEEVGHAGNSPLGRTLYSTGAGYWSVVHNSRGSCVCLPSPPLPSSEIPAPRCCPARSPACLYRRAAASA